MHYDHEYAYKDDLIDDEANNSDNRFDAYTCDERYARNPDVSGSWRAEYRAQGVDPDGNKHELVTDGRSDTDDRPTDCICWDDTSTLPCFPCCRGGIRQRRRPRRRRSRMSGYESTRFERVCDQSEMSHLAFLIPSLKTAVEAQGEGD